MKFFLITDDADTCVGMRLAGVESQLVHDADRAREALEQAAKEENIAVLLYTAKIKEYCAERITQLSAGNRPILVEIPDSSNVGKTGGALGDYIRATIGVSI